MEMENEILLSWSGGKDSSLVLYQLSNDSNYKIKSLITTVTDNFNRISMHGVRTSLLDRQANSLEINVEKVFISQNCSNEEYESNLEKTLLKYKKTGVRVVAYGDIFLEDIKNYRINHLKKLNMTAIFPIWKENSQKLASKFINLGFKAVVVCVDSKHLNKDYVGKEFDNSFLSELPSQTDPCGENGEFHTFVYDGPIFNSPVSFNIGETVLRDNRFYYCDLVPS